MIAKVIYKMTCGRLPRIATDLPAAGGNIVWNKGSDRPLRVFTTLSPDRIRDRDEFEFVSKKVNEGAMYYVYPAWICKLFWVVITGIVSAISAIFVKPC